MSLPRRSHMLGPVAYAERGRCALPLHIGLRAPGKEHGEIDLHHIGCSVASHAGSPAVQPQGASATSPSRGAADPAFLFRTGANIQFSGSSACAARCRNRCSWLLPAQFAITGTLRWRLSMHLCSYRRCALFAEAWVFLLDFITLLSRFRHLICSALRKVTVKNFFNE